MWAHWPIQGFKNREASHRNSDCCFLLTNQKLELSGPASPQSYGGRTAQGAPVQGHRSLVDCTSSLSPWAEAGANLKLVHFQV